LTPGPREGHEGQGAAGRNFLLVRTGISFALLASVVTVQWRTPEIPFSAGFQHIYFAVLLSYGWLLVRYAAWGGRELPSPAVYIQALVDVAFISILVFATGGYESVFSFMYVLVILLGSLERHMRGAAVWALLSSASYGLLVYFQMEGRLIPPGADDTVITVVQFVRAAGIHSAGFFLTGVLSGLLGEDIRKGRERVHDRDEVIRTLEMFHKNVVDNIPSGILTTDTRGKVNLLNETACVILGASREELVGRPLGEVLSGIEGADGRSARDDPPVVRPEIRFVRSDGAEIFLGFSASQMKDPDGDVIGRVVIFQDLTPIKQMEERVRIADRLAGVGELAAGLAHEIRNPLASIAGSSQLLRESPDDAATLLEIIERESKRLNGLISDFLSYTATSLRAVATVPLTRLLHEVVAAVRAGEGREKGVRIEYNASHELTVLGDAEQLKQVAWNLIRNAVQATPPDGRILVDTFEQIRQGARYVVMTIADSGAGIDAKDLGKIFNPFYTTKEGGTGLGLSISQRIVQYHNGFIEARSSAGEGSTFSVFLPASGTPNRGVDHGVA
jgi:two-component system, NtrC family, sensor histidine kinase PilS